MRGCFFLRARIQRNRPAAKNARTPRVTPTPMPALAPVLRPVVGGAVGEGEVPVVVVVAAAGFVFRDFEDGLDAEVVVGVEGDGDAVDVASEVDHVVAERSDWSSTRKFPLLELLPVPMSGPFVSLRFR